MNKLIYTFKGSKSNKLLGKIRLGTEYETFNMNTIEWSRNDYEKQWAHAANYSLDRRDTSAFIKSYESSYSHVKALSIYTIIPDELSNPIKYFNSLTEKLGFKITESFMFVTEDINMLKSDVAFQEIFEVYDNYFPIYYLDINHLDRFYLYLSTKVDGISSWNISIEELKQIAEG